MLLLRDTNLSQNLVKLWEWVALTFLIISPESGAGETYNCFQVLERSWNLTQFEGP